MCGITPTHTFPSRSSIIRTPGSSNARSPRNLLIANPSTRARSSGSSSSTVPSSDANTPPRSMSPTSRQLASAIAATRIFTMSCAFRLISAGDPAPSITITSKLSASLS